MRIVKAQHRLKAGLCTGALPSRSFQEPFSALWIAKRKFQKAAECYGGSFIGAANQNKGSWWPHRQIPS